MKELTRLATCISECFFVGKSLKRRYRRHLYSRLEKPEKYKKVGFDSKIGPRIAFAYEDKKILGVNPLQFLAIETAGWGGKRAYLRHYITRTFDAIFILYLLMFSVFAFVAYDIWWHSLNSLETKLAVSIEGTVFEGLVRLILSSLFLLPALFSLGFLTNTIIVRVQHIRKCCRFKKEINKGP